MTTTITTPTPAKRSGLMRNRLFVGSLVVLAVLIAVVVIAFVALQINRGSRRTPIAYEVYPGATVVSTNEGTSGVGKSDVNVYQTPASVNDVFRFYAGKFGLIDPQSDGNSANDNDNGCRVTDVNLADPASAACTISNSQDDLIHELIMQIITDGQGQTTITVTRAWGG